MSQELIDNSFIKTAIERIPDFNSYIANLNELKSLDFTNSEANYVHDKFFELATILPMNYAFFHKEKSYFKASEALANERFRDAKKSVPSYKKITENFAINNDSPFS